MKGETIRKVKRMKEAERDKSEVNKARERGQRED